MTPIPHNQALPRSSRRRIAKAAFGAALAFAGTGVVPAQTAPTAEQTVELDEFIVTGYRGSLTQALDIKRESVQLVDSIVSEDIGKLPDNNLVESLQRVSGIQVTNRGAGEVATVSIRGLTDINTTLNGQNVFTSSGQSIALQDIPATLLARVDVYKTRSADLVENGIAGSIDIRTHRPFDFRGRRISLAARGIYQEQSDEIGPNYSALFSDRWTTSAGEIGVLLNLSYAKTPYRDQNVTAGAMMPFATDDPPANLVPYQLIRSVYTQNGAEPNAVDPQYWGVPIWTPGLDTGLPTAPGSTLTVGGETKPYILSRDAIFQNDFTGERERPAANVTLQWAPHADAEYTFQAFYDGYRNTSFNNLFFSFVDWWGGPHGPITLYPGTNIVKSRDLVSNVYGFTSGDATESKTDSYVLMLSGKWNISDALKLRSAATYQSSEFETQFFAMRADRVAPGISVDFNSGGGLPAFQMLDNPDTPTNEADLTDPGLWNVAQLYDNGDKDEGSAKTITLDGDYTPDWVFLTALRFGLRYDDREASESERRQDAGALQQPLSNFPELAHVNSDFFDGNSDVPRTWVVPNGLAIFEDADKYRALYKAKYPNFKTGDQLSLFENFNVREKNTAVYLRADFKTFIGTRKLDGQIGGRYVSVKTDMEFTDPATLTVGRGSAKTNKLLPSGSLRFAITQDLIARASYAETLRRPNFNQLNPNITYVRDVTNIGYGTATGGNPNLKPTESKNYDLSLEWYFSKSNAVYVTAFKREIEGFVVDFRRRVSAIVAPDTTPYDYILSQPDNASNGELKGLEFGFVYFPDNLPSFLQGIGVQASYTSLDSQQDIPVTDTTGAVTGTLTRPIFGVSDSSYSVVLAYEKKRFSGRLAYVWRDDFLNNYEAALFANPLGIYRKPEQSLDLQLSYRVSDNFSVTFDATNLTGEIYQSYYQYPETNPFGSSLYSRTFAIGARFSF